MKYFLKLALLLLLPVFSTAQNTANQHIVTGTILLSNRTFPLQKKLADQMKADWKMRVDSVTISDKTMIFSVPGATVMIAYLDYPFAPAEIAAAARLSWLWPNAAAEASQHQAQLIISVIGSAGKTLELYQSFTKTAAAILENTASIGVYMNSQYLLLPSAFYKSAAHNMVLNNTLPLYCWVYFGMVQENGKSGGYTYGMEAFEIPEMEIVASEGSIQETHALLYDVAHYLLLYRQKPSASQSLTTAEGQTVAFEWSKAAYQSGNTWKVLLKP
jgi:hypothetical protein